MIESLTEIEGNTSQSQNLENHILQTCENLYKYIDLMFTNESKYGNH